MAGVPLSSNQVTHQLGTRGGADRLWRAPSMTSLALTSPERLRRGGAGGPVGADGAGRAGRASGVAWGSPDRAARRPLADTFGADLARIVPGSGATAGAAAPAERARNNNDDEEAASSSASPHRGRCFGPETVSPQRLSPMRGSPGRFCASGNQQHTPWRPRPPWQDQENRNNNEEDQWQNAGITSAQGVDDRVEEEQAWHEQEYEWQQRHRHDHQLEDLNRHTDEIMSARTRSSGSAMATGPTFVRPRSRGLQIHRQIAGF